MKALGVQLEKQAEQIARDMTEQRRERIAEQKTEQELQYVIVQNGVIKNQVSENIVEDQMYSLEMYNRLQAEQDIDALEREQELAAITRESTQRKRRIQDRQNRLMKRKQYSCMAGTVAGVLLVIVVLLFANPVTSKANADFKYYKYITVEADNSLWTIADQYITYDHYDSKKEYINEVCQINHIQDADKIRQGQRIAVPYYDSKYVE